MAADKYQQLIGRTRNSRHACLLPYFTAGYPNADASAELIRRAAADGCAAIEIGVPYSDSIADGPVIQASFHQVLRRGFGVEDTFHLVSRVRDSVSCALTAMVSYSIVHRYGVDRFMARAAEVGFDGVILPDVPIEESETPIAAAADHGLCTVGLVAPTTTARRREAIAKGATGFIYQIAVAGTTGERSDLPAGLAEEVAGLRELSGLPVCVGFGIANPEQVRAVCQIADGAIVGSAIIRRISQAVEAGMKLSDLVENVAAFVQSLLHECQV